jgi:hypothetical protein
MPVPKDERLTREDLEKWAEKASARTEPYEVENPADVFFSDPEMRDRYAAPVNEHMCLIDLSAFEAGKPVEGLHYSKCTEIEPGGGTVFQLMLSEDGERLAMNSIYAIPALRTGAIKPEEMVSDKGPQPMGAAVVVVPAAKCLANSVCREAVRNIVGGAAFVEGTKGLGRLLRRFLSQD